MFYNTTTKYMNYFQLKIKHENIEQKRILTVSCISSLKFKVATVGSIGFFFMQVLTG